MANGNANDWFWAIMRWGGAIIAATLVIISLIYTIVYAPLSCAIALETTKREAALSDQSKINTELLTVVAELKVEVRYLRLALQGGNNDNANRQAR